MMHTDGASRPTAGALRLIEGRSENPKSADVSAYVTAMYEYCPFLAPSVDRGLTGWTVYEIASENRYAVEAELFHAGVQAAEWIRPLKDRSHGALVCENIVILGALEDTDYRELMRCPYWALRHLYASVGVVFGKFYEGAQEVDKFGRSIPSAPYSFLPVRASVRTLDQRFLTSTPELAQALAMGVDDGRDVFKQHGLSNDWKEVRAWASSLSVRPKQ